MEPEMSAAADPPHPSRAELLAAEYGHSWEIWRSTGTDGKHGDWHARTLPHVTPAKHLHAESTEELADLLQKEEG
jgi:hypothetical protein